MSDNLNSEEELGASRFAAIAKAEYEKQAREDWQAFKPKLLKACLEAANQGKNIANVHAPTHTSSWIAEKLEKLGYMCHIVSTPDQTESKFIIGFDKEEA